MPGGSGEVPGHEHKDGTVMDMQGERRCCRGNRERFADTYWCESRIIPMLFMVVLAFFGRARARADEQPWWDNYPIIVQGGLDAASTYHVDVAFYGSVSEPGWGTYGLKNNVGVDILNEFHNQGYKDLSYYEAFGQALCFIAELGQNNGDYTTLPAIYWDWQDYSGGTIVWVGAQNFFDDEAFARPYTRTNPTYGGVAMTYPDGTVATGYNGPSTDPRNSRVFDAGCSKNILGEISYDPGVVNDTVVNNGPYDGLLQINGQYVGLISFSKDSACPMWNNMDAAAAKLSASLGSDGIWADNFSAWDSFNTQPVRDAFGDWSVALFRDYLSAHFTAGELSSMGVSDVSTFDVRTALRAQCVAWGGDDTNLTDPVWNDPRWLDNPLWHAYEIFKRQKGTEALTNFYNGVKQAAASVGKPDFFVCGNDIPAISLGWVRGNLDMVSTETKPGNYIDSGPRGFLIPPVGRMAPQYKLAREHAKSRLVSCLMQNDDFSAYIDNPELSNTMLYEMLANDALPMDEPTWPDWAFTEASTQAFNLFVKSIRSTLGQRKGVADIGIYYSSSSLLAYMTPGTIFDVANRQHQYGLYGWATALDELHYQYRDVLEWKLNAETLAGLKVLIIPNAVVFDPSDVTNVLMPWVQSGGRLIVTEDSGLRLGESGNFDLNPSGLSLAPLTGVSSMTPAPTQHVQTVGSGKVLYIPTNVGMEYYNNDTQRATLIGGLSSDMDQILSGLTPVLSAPTAPSTEGLTLYRDKAAHKQIIDANNMNIDLGTDTVTPVTATTFDVDVPDWLDVPDLRVSALSPDGAVTVSISNRVTGRASIDVGSVKHYASLVMDFPDADGDGLSDATEVSLGTDPNKADTDGDGVTDYAEVNYDGNIAYNPYDPVNNPTGTDLNALVVDTDNDGVTDGLETTYGTNPLDMTETVQLPIGYWSIFVVLGALGWVAVRRRRARWTA